MLEATFFFTQREQATGCYGADSLPADPAGEPLQVPSPAALIALERLLLARAPARIRRRRDSTYRSFPIWVFDAKLCSVLARLDDSEIDHLATAWLDDEATEGMDSDLFEIATLLADLQAAMRQSTSLGDELFIYLEDKAY